MGRQPGPVYRAYQMRLELGHQIRIEDVVGALGVVLINVRVIARGRLIGLTDRVDALGGAIHVVSPVGQGTTLHVTLPIEPS